jgi:hypothetical protein
MSQGKNWVGLWYKIGRELGTNDTMTFMKVNARTREVQWTFQSHEHSDGLGWLVTILRGEGAEIAEVPQGRNRALRLRDWLRLVPRFLKDLKPQTAPWKQRHLSPRAADKFEIAWEAFTVEETESFKQRAARKGLSINSILLATFDRVIRERYVAGDGPSPWLFPVNMRGIVAGYTETQHQSSAVGVKCWRGITPEEVHENIRGPLRDHIHVATWHTLHIGKLVGERGMRWLAKRRADKNHWMGTFSNMGELPAPGWKIPQLGPDEFWIASPPGTPSFPVGICCLTWNGRLAMSLKIHPSLCERFEEVQAILAEVKRHVGAEWAYPKVRLTDVPQAA